MKRMDIASRIHGFDIYQSAIFPRVFYAKLKENLTFKVKKRQRLGRDDSQHNE